MDFSEMVVGHRYMIRYRRGENVEDYPHAVFEGSGYLRFREAPESEREIVAATMPTSGGRPLLFEVTEIVEIIPQD